MPLQFTKLHKGWVEIEGDPVLPIPSFANPATLRFDTTYLWMELQSCPEVSALLNGHKYKDGGQFLGNFECELRGTTGILKTISGSSGYSIDENDLKTAQFRAYYLPSAEAKEAVEVAIVETITDKTQITLSAGGRIEASANLVGRNLKVQCTYPSTVVIDAENKAESLRVHLVGTLDNGKMGYATMEGCSFVVEGKFLKVVVNDSLKVADLSIQVIANEPSQIAKMSIS